MQFQITCNSSFLTFGGSLTFFSHLTVLSSHYAVPTSHVTVLSHIGWFLYFFLTLDDSIITFCSFNITCDNSFLTLGGSLTFFLTFDVLSSYCAVPTSHMTILFSHLVVSLLFFFSHLTVSSSHCALPTSYMTVFLSHWVVPLLFSHT